MPFTVSDTYTEELLQYHTIEQQLLGKEDFDDSDEDCVIESACSHIIQPYAPFGKDGPQVTLQSAMSLINRLVYTSCYHVCNLFIVKTCSNL